MKKIFLLSFFSLIFADSINFYTFTLKENYKEYINNQIVDRDYNNFNDMYGIGIEYKKNLTNIDLFLNSEYSSGSKTYDGAYQDTTPLKASVNNSYLYKISAGIDFRPYFIKLGYRFWNRGDSNNPGDYNEQYYWSYLATGINYKALINNFFIKTNIQYQYAFKPKLKIYLGNSPVVDLGNTKGFMGKIDMGFKLDMKTSFGIFYKYDFWHINKSKKFILTLNNQQWLMFEPESKTRNQYLGVYYQMNF